MRQHGAGKRRTWRKVYLAIDPSTHTILAQTTTWNDSHDASQVKPLLEQIPGEVRALYADGAYDHWDVRDYLKSEKISQVIPPRKNAPQTRKRYASSMATPAPSRWSARECLRQIRRDGRKAWKESIGYHRRSLGETAMSRLQGAFGERLKNRTQPNQAVEVALRCKLLNAFVALGMPLLILSKATRPLASTLRDIVSEPQQHH